MNYKIAPNSGVTGLEAGRVYSREQIEENKSLGGVNRLLSHKTIVETDEDVTPAEGAEPIPQNVTGNPAPISQDPERQEEFRREHSSGPGDAAEKANPRTGKSGTVQRVTAPAKPHGAKDE